MSLPEKRITIRRAKCENLSDILALQKLAYQTEAELYNDWSLPPLTQSIESLTEEFQNGVLLKATLGDRIVGSVRAKATQGVCSIGRLIVHPEFQGQGIGSKLLQSIETSFAEVTKYELFTGTKSEANIRLYQRHGYAIHHTQTVSATVSLVFLEKIATGKLG